MRSCHPSPVGWCAVLVVAALGPGVCQAQARLLADRIDAGNAIVFEDRTARILPQSLAMLDQVAALLLANPSVTVEVQAHTDSMRTEVYNFRLTCDRAAAVVDYLVRAGVPRSRLRSQGYGEACPIADNMTEAGRAANLRVVFFRTDTGLTSQCRVPSFPPSPGSGQ